MSDSRMSARIQHAITAIWVSDYAQPLSPMVEDPDRVLCAVMESVLPLNDTGMAREVSNLRTSGL